MLKVNNLVGFGSGGGTPFAVKNAASLADETNLSTYTFDFTGEWDIGDFVVIGTAAYDGGSNAQVPTVTANGVSLTGAVSVASGGKSCAIFAGVVNAASGNVVVAYGGVGHNGCACYLVSANPPDSQTPTSTVLNEGTNTLSITPNAGGLVFVMGQHNSTTPFTYTNITNIGGLQYNGAQYQANAGYVSQAAGSQITTVTTEINVDSFLAAAWR